jgi:hypothetical protein
MPNISAPFGLKPVKQINGSSWNTAVNMYFIPQADTNAYYIGDVVRSAAGGDFTTGAPAVTLFGTRNAASTTGAARGVIVGLGSSVASPGGNSPQAFDPDNLNVLFIPATKTKNYYVWVVDSPSVIFEAQADSIIAANFGKNAPLFVANAPVAPVNQSISFVQGSAAAVTQALPLKIIGGPARTDNELDPPGTFGRVWVLINQHELAGNTVGV